MRGTPFLKEGFFKGLNTIDSPYTLQEGETRDCMNVVSTERGAIKKRTGSTLFNKSAETPNVELISLFPVTISGTTYLIASGGKNLYSINSAGEVSTIGEGFTEGKRWSFVQAPANAKAGEAKPLQKEGGPVYLLNGVDKPQYWTGVEKAIKVAEWIGAEGEYEEPVSKAKVKGYEDATSKKHVPNGKYAVFHGNRVWVAGMSDDKSAVRFSGQALIGEGGGEADPTSWPSEQVVRFDAEDGYPITGLATVGPYILVFKANKTWVIHNLDSGESRRLSENVGCVAPRTVVETSLGTLFLTADKGVYLTNGTTLKEMSYNVRPSLLAINPAKRENACGAYLNNHYYVSIAEGTSATNNRTYDYDIVLKSWWRHDLAGNQWCIWEPAEGEPLLFTIRPIVKDGVTKCFVAGVFQDHEKNYTGSGTLGAYWFSPWEPFAYYIFRHRIKAPFLKKRVRQIFFNGSGQIIPAVFKNFLTGERQEKAVVGNNPETEPELPVNFAAGSEKWGEGSGVWGVETAGAEVLWGGEVTTGQARIYAPGIASVWGVGWGNNSSEPFEVDAYAYMIQFRKS